MGGRAAALLLAIATAVAVLAPAPVSAAEGDGGAAKRLQEVESELSKGKARAEALEREAESLTQEAANLRHEMVAAASRIQSHERGVEELTARLARLTALEERKSTELASRRKQFAEVLMALQRIANFPPEALIARPMSPADTVRSALLLKSAVPEIERKAVQLREEITFLAETRKEAAQRKAELTAEREALEAERQEMRVLLARKEVLRRRTLASSRDAERRVEKLAQEAGNLRDLMARLAERRRQEQEQARRMAAAARGAKPTAPRPAAPEEAAPAPAETETETASVAPGARPPDFPDEPISGARGDLAMPVVGEVIGNYGEKTPSGLTRRGLDFETRPTAQVVAPYAGQIVYAGPFRGYGLLLIIEHTEGYHSLMAGMERIHGTIGQWVLAGEPVAEMTDSAGKNPILYLELRRDGQPVNPLPWLASRKDKASG